ncbi:MAG: VWA domain-containing protein [Chloroflexi bacterium]|nr:VWA domain-containing protein [Chloroflexota bacterium]
MSPTVLLLLVLLPPVMALLIWRERARRKKTRRLAEPVLLSQLLPPDHARRRTWELILWPVVVASLIVALARPAWGEEPSIVVSQGVSLMIVLDVSSSMNAADLRPSRLERAKLDIRGLLPELDGYEVGLILFAGSAFVQFPLTTDLLSAETFLNGATGAAVSRQGTAIEAALRLAVEAFGSRSSARIILLATDGENHEGDPLAAAEQAANEGITLHVLGYGGTQGEPVPVLDAAGNVAGYKADASGNVILSALDEDILQQIAGRGNGVYRRAGVEGTEIVALLSQMRAREGGGQEITARSQNVERSGIFVALALLALSADLLAALLYEGRLTDGRQTLLALLVMVLAGCDVNPSERIGAGGDLYRRGDYLGAVEAFQLAQAVAPDQPEAYYNAASALARSGQLRRAVAALEQAIRFADAELAAKAYYNLGNVYFEMSRFPEAIGAYQDALRLNPADEEARYNLELALRRAAPPAVTPVSETPAPPPDAPSPTGTAPVPPPPAGPLTVEDAEQLLDAVQNQQQTLGDYLRKLTPQAQPVEKDW